MAFLSKNAVVFSVLFAACAFILQQTGYQPLKSQDIIEANLNAYAATTDGPDTFVMYAGRLFYFVTTLAWAVVIVQSLVAAVRRYQHRPAAIPPLRPLSPEEVEQQKAEQQAAKASATASQPKQPPAPQKLTPTRTAESQQHQTQQAKPNKREESLEERRRRVAEEKQRQLDEAAAAVKQQQERQEAERRERAAAAAAHAAELQRQRDQAQQAARAEEARRWELWEQAVTQHYQRATESTSQTRSRPQPPQQQETPASAGSSLPSSSSAAAADQAALAAAAVEDARILKQQQDQEFQESLAADRKRQQHERQQQLLKQLKQLLQRQFDAEPQGESGEDGLTVRVRLPDGAAAVRHFAADQNLNDVYNWVFGLPAMTSSTPGTWSLCTTFPKQHIIPSTGIWSPGGFSTDGNELQDLVQQLQQAADAVDPGLWSLNIRLLKGQEFAVLVRDESTVVDVKEKIAMQTGIPTEAQRLIFSGHILPEQPTLQQLGISAQHTLQLASTLAASSSTTKHAQQTPSSAARVSDAGSDTAVAVTTPEVRTVAEGGSAEGLNKDGGSTSADVLVITDVGQLREQVAHGASQLALYVVAEGA